MRFVPIGSHPDIDFQWRPQFRRSGHRRPNPLPGFQHGLPGHLEHQLIVNLHQHPRREIGFLQPAIHRQHRPFDDVGGGTLHRRVDGGTLRRLSELRISSADVRQIQPATEYRLDITPLGGLAAGVVHVCLDAGIAGKIAIDITFGRATLDAQLLG